MENLHGSYKVLRQVNYSFLSGKILKMAIDAIKKFKATGCFEFIKIN